MRKLCVCVCVCVLSWSVTHCNPKVVERSLLGEPLGPTGTDIVGECLAACEYSIANHAAVLIASLPARE